MKPSERIKNAPHMYLQNIEGEQFLHKDIMGVIIECLDELYEAQQKPKVGLELTDDELDTCSHHLLGVLAAGICSKKDQPIIAEITSKIESYLEAKGYYEDEQ